MDQLPNFDFGIDFGLETESSFGFVEIPDDEIDAFILGQKAKTTKYKEVSDLNIFTRFCKTINEFRNIECMPERDLDNILCQFFMKALTKKSTLYEPDTLTSIRNSLQRILIEKGCKFNLRQGDAFVKSREVLAARRKQLVKLGKGNSPNASRPLTEDEVTYLYTCGYFGKNNPASLQRAIWWEITTHFGHRARDEARQLNFGDIKIIKEFNSASEYLLWDTERSTKTRNGARPMGHKRQIDPKAFSTGTERCPVKLYRLFVSHRPTSMCCEDSPLFLAIRYNINDYNSEKIWYHAKPLGKNTIGDILTKARDSLLSGNPVTNKGKISNHSARKTTITNLLNQDVNPIHVKQISGHKKLESLASYDVASIKQQKKMSNVISVGDEGSSTSNKDENTMCPSISNEMLKPWDPVTNTLFHGTTFNNCTFNIEINNSEIPKKRRRIRVIDDSSDSE